MKKTRNRSEKRLAKDNVVIRGNNKKGKNNLIIVSLKILVSILILAFLSQKIVVSDFQNEFRSFQLLPILISLLIMPIIMVIKAYRWGEVISTCHSKIKLSIMIPITYIGTTIGIITPGRLGEFIKVYHLNKKTGISIKKALYTAIIDKLFDIVTIVTFSFMGLYIIFNNSLFLVLFVLSFLLSMVIHWPFNSAIELIKHLPYLKSYAKEGIKYKINHRDSIKLMLLSYLIFLLFGMQAYVILIMLNGSAFNYLIAVSMVCLMTFSSFVPITFAGVGLREAIAVYLLAIIGISASKAALFSLGFTVVSLGVAAIIGVYYIIKFK